MSPDFDGIENLDQIQCDCEVCVLTKQLVNLLDDPVTRSKLILGDEAELSVILKKSFGLEKWSDLTLGQKVQFAYNHVQLRLAVNRMGLKPDEISAVVKMINHNFDCVKKAESARYN